MGCGSSNHNIIVEDENEDEKELAYRHAIRMAKYLFDEMGSCIFTSNWNLLND